MMDILIHLYAPGLCLFLGICALFCCREPADDPFGDAADGDWPAIPEDLKVSRFHEATNTVGETNCGA